MTRRQVAYCPGCGTLGTEARQLGPYEREGRPTARLRICPPCGDAGWRLDEAYVATAQGRRGPLRPLETA